MKKSTKPRQRPEPIEYDVNLAALLKAGATQPFWQAIKKITEANIYFVEEMVLSDKDETLSERIEVTRRELLVKWRSYLLELVKLPEKVAESIESGNVTDSINFDPYIGVLGKITEVDKSKV